MITHHPDSNTLVEFSSGTLPVAHSVCVSTHLDHCSECRSKLAKLDDLGGAMLENGTAESVSSSVFDAVMLRLDEVSPEPAANDATAASLSSMVKKIRSGATADLNWRRVTKSLRIASLGDVPGASEVSVYHISEGGKIPQHNHSGTEMTLVLSGGFSDETGTYHAGDFLVREAGDIHAPTALPGGDCICLAVLESPLKFTRWHYRWLNPLLQLRAG